MIEKKYFEKIILCLMAVLVVLCGIGVCFQSDLEALGEEAGVTMEYESRLFDTDEPLTIKIEMADADWEDLLANPLDETYYVCSVTINGTTFRNVGVRTKGNTSLSNIASDPTTDRYSLKLEFDHYVKGQTCFGLDKLILNNSYADNTYMKEAIVYDMFAYLDADASLYTYAAVTVNDEYRGLYFALEGVEDSFLVRNYGAKSGNLYKPETTNMDGAKGDKNEMMQRQDGAEAPEGMKLPDGAEAPDGMELPDGAAAPAGMGGKMDAAGGGMGGAGGTSGCDLNYTDDDLDSYSGIWDSEVTDTGKKDHKRVVEALKNISEGTDLETYMDVDNLLKYMAVHTFAVNLDSLSGNMAHNYYLYESEGRLNLIPWDYNLSWGGFQMGSTGGASDTINFPIDTPFSSGISLEDREFFAALLENETYLAQYHEYLRILCEEYVDGGVFETRVSEIRSQIDDLVKTDPTAFVTYEEYETGVSALKQVVSLRAQSIEGQLDGTIPSTTEGQSEDPQALLSAGDLDLTALGSQGGGGHGGMMNGEQNPGQFQPDMKNNGRGGMENGRQNAPGNKEE